MTALLRIERPADDGTRMVYWFTTAGELDGCTLQTRVGLGARWRDVRQWQASDRDQPPLPADVLAEVREAIKPVRTTTKPTPADVARMSATLKPCPFCGSPSEVEWTPVPDFRRDSKPGEFTSISWHVRCTAVGSRCPMGNHWLCSTSAGAVEAWNRRAALPTAPAEVRRRTAGEAEATT